MPITQIVWLVLVVIFIIIEASTAMLLSVWFCAGSATALIVSAFLPEWVGLQVAAFLLVSFVTLFALRPLARRLSSGSFIPTNSDANIGKVCQVTSQVEPAHFGRANLEGRDWTVKSEYVLPVGTWCRVVGIEGVKLVLVPLGAEQQQHPQGQQPF